MSWLVNSIATSLTIDDEDDDDFDPETTKFTAAATPIVGENRRNPNLTDDHDDRQQIHSRQIESYDESTAHRGVKDDLSELSDTFSRQLWGVASFLSPPPQISDRDRQSESSDEDYGNSGERIAGIRSKVEEDDFPTGISNFAQYESDEEEEVSVEDYARRGVVGVTEEVVAFARGIALHPETWIDFPLPDDDVEEDFEFSDAQQDHALAVERLAPELAAVRIELCLSYMSEACFWKIYFALVHPRLSRHDAEILSTPEIVKARAMLSQELHSHSKSKPYEYGSGNTSADHHTMLSHEEHSSFPVFSQFERTPIEISSVGPAPSLEADVEMDKHAVVSTEIPVVDKKVVEEVSMKHTNSEKPTTIISRFIDQKYEDDSDDDWLEEVNSEAGPLKGTSYPPGDYEDISFSDLEDDEDVPSNYRKVKIPNEKVSSDTLKNKGSIDLLDTKNIGIA